MDTIRKNLQSAIELKNLPPAELIKVAKNKTINSKVENLEIQIAAGKEVRLNLKNTKRLQVELGANSNLEIVAELIAVDFQYKIKIAKDASLKSLIIPERSVRGEVVIDLVGNNSKARSNVATITANKESQEIYIKHNHIGKNTRGKITAKGIVRDEAKTNVFGLINIEEYAKKTESYEDIDIKLLSKKATTNSLPELYIDTNDVSATHTFTAGEFDEENTFYLQSRGFSQENTLQLMLSGFFEPILNNFKNIRRIKKSLKEKLNA
ncbi:MAG: SufD family Fe-S cluster assembly protein [bacterium]